MDPENTLIMTLEAGAVTIKLRPDLAPKHVERPTDCSVHAELGEQLHEAALDQPAVRRHQTLHAQADAEHGDPGGAEHLGAAESARGIAGVEPNVRQLLSTGEPEGKVGILDVLARPREVGAVALGAAKLILAAPSLFDAAPRITARIVSPFLIASSRRLRTTTPTPLLNTVP